MGYRSDVYMCIRGPTKSILAGIATLRLEGDTAMHEALDEWNVTACSETHATMVLGVRGEAGNGTRATLTSRPITKYTTTFRTSPKKIRNSTARLCA